MIKFIHSFILQASSLVVVTDLISGVSVASSPAKEEYVIISLLLLLLLLLTNLCLCLSVSLPLSQLILVVFYHVSF